MRTLGRMNAVRASREDGKAQSSPAAEGQAAMPFRAHEISSYYGPGLVPGTREVQMLRNTVPGAQTDTEGTVFWSVEVSPQMHAVSV